MIALPENELNPSVTVPLLPLLFPVVVMIWSTGWVKVTVALFSSTAVPPAPVSLKSVFPFITSTPSVKLEKFAAVMGTGFPSKNASKIIVSPKLIPLAMKERSSTGLLKLNVYCALSLGKSPVPSGWTKSKSPPRIGSGWTWMPPTNPGLPFPLLMSSASKSSNPLNSPSSCAVLPI